MIDSYRRVMSWLPRLWRTLPAGLVLVWTILSAGPAVAAPCTGITCVRYYADITVSATVDPAEPVFAGVIHAYTVRVTNTGWRVGGNTAPRPGIGPDSGPVYVNLYRAPGEVDLAFTNDSGVPFDCFRWGSGGGHVVCHAGSLPTGTTSQFTAYFQTPGVPGTYQFPIRVDSYRWTEYDETNNSLTLTYSVG